MSRCPASTYYDFRGIKKLIHDGKITEKDIDNLVLPVIRTKLIFISRKDIRSDPPKSDRDVRSMWPSPERWQKKALYY